MNLNQRGGMSKDNIKKVEELILELSKSCVDVDSRVELVNKLKRVVNVISPHKDNPVDCVLWVKSESVTANDYNPNSVAPPEMILLEHSIGQDGYTQPIVAWELPGDGGAVKYEVVDGFHRNRVGRECNEVFNKNHGCLPVALVNAGRTEKADRIASTIRHNRARGKHGVTAMSDIVLELKRRNWSDKKIAKDLGLDQDEILRLTQISGLAEMFADKEFSEAWEAQHLNDEDFTQFTKEDAANDRAGLSSILDVGRDVNEYVD